MALIPTSLFSDWSEGAKFAFEKRNKVQKEKKWTNFARGKWARHGPIGLRTFSCSGETDCRGESLVRGSVIANHNWHVEKKVGSRNNTILDSGNFQSSMHRILQCQARIKNVFGAKFSFATIGDCWLVWSSLVCGYHLLRASNSTNYDDDKSLSNTTCTWTKNGFHVVDATFSFRFKPWALSQNSKHELLLENHT